MDSDDAQPADLDGSVDERIAQLAILETRGERLPTEWLRRQLHAALTAWADDETELDVDAETRIDF